MTRLAPEALHLLRGGEAPRQIVARLAARPESIARALHNAGHTREARDFWRESNRDRTRDRA